MNKIEKKTQSQLRVGKRCAGQVGLQIRFIPLTPSTCLCRNQVRWRNVKREKPPKPLFSSIKIFFIIFLRVFLNSTRSKKKITRQYGFFVRINAFLIDSDTLCFKKNAFPCCRNFMELIKLNSCWFIGSIFELVARFGGRNENNGFRK